MDTDDGTTTGTPTADGGTAGVSDDERTWAIVAHLAAFAGVVVPFGHIVGPLAVYLIKQEEGPFVEHHGKEAVNFQISMTIYFVVAGILTVVLIGILLLVIGAIAWLVLVVIAAIRASDREEYEYPYALDLV